jgi:RNA polymerase sigma-70 factor (ECF subfamily)
VTRSDGELLRAHLAGDRYAFAELFRRYQGVLWRVARRYLDDQEDAVDAVQDALIRAYQRAASCRDGDSVRAWLIQIVVNTCRDRYRRNRARPARPTEATVLERVPAPRDPIADHEDRMLVESLLETLPAEQAIVVDLVHLRGYPVAEVARMLDVSVGTVKSRGHRGRARMADALRPSRALQPAGEDQ